MTKKTVVLGIFCLGLALVPVSVLACACGCDIFSVGNQAGMPTATGGMVYVDYNFMDQNQAWSGTAQSSGAMDDAQITTHFLTFGGQYMFDRTWGVNVEIPYWNRHYKGVDEDSNPLDLNFSGLGDIRVKGIFTGLAEDMSVGVTLGLKLPTGGFHAFGLDRDLQIGTGSTDLLLGGYQFGTILGDKTWRWLGNLNLRLPVLTQEDYLPGSELTGSLGIYYYGWSFSDGLTVIPEMKVVGDYRGHDGGFNGNSVNSGYRRVVLAPGMNVELGQWRASASMGFPIYQVVAGEQLVAPNLVKVNVGFVF